MLVQPVPVLLETINELNKISKLFLPLQASNKVKCILWHCELQSESGQNSRPVRWVLSSGSLCKSENGWIISKCSIHQEIVEIQLVCGTLKLRRASHRAVDLVTSGLDPQCDQGTPRNLLRLGWYYQPTPFPSCLRMNVSRLCDLTNENALKTLFWLTASTKELLREVESNFVPA